MACFREILDATASSLHALGGTADAQAFFGTILSTFATLMGLIGLFAVYAHQRASDDIRQDTARTLRRLRRTLMGQGVPEEEVDRLVPPNDLTPCEALALIKSNQKRFFEVSKSYLKELPHAQMQDRVMQTDPTFESFITSLERMGDNDQTIGNVNRLARRSLVLNGFIALVALLGMPLAPFLSSRGWLASSEWAITAAGMAVLIWNIVIGVRLVASVGSGFVKAALKPKLPGSGD
jgi:hypothetical protein